MKIKTISEIEKEDSVKFDQFIDNIIEALIADER